VANPSNAALWFRCNDADIHGRQSYRRYLANTSVAQLLELHVNNSAAARRAVVRQLRLVNDSLAQLDALPPHPTVEDLHLAVARSGTSTSLVDNVTWRDRPPSSHIRPPTAGGWLPPLLHRHRRWAGNCVEKTDTKLSAWIAEPGKQIELPCVTWYTFFIFHVSVQLSYRRSLSYHLRLSGTDES